MNDDNSAPAADVHTSPEVQRTLLPDEAAYQLHGQAEQWQFVAQITHHLAHLEVQLAAMLGSQEISEPHALTQRAEAPTLHTYLQLAEEALHLTSTALRHVQTLANREASLLETPAAQRQASLRAHTALVSSACAQLAAAAATATNLPSEARAALLALHSQLASDFDVRSVNHFVRAVRTLASGVPEIHELWTQYADVLGPFTS